MGIFVENGLLTTQKGLTVNGGIIGSLRKGLRRALGLSISSLAIGIFLPSPSPANDWSDNIRLKGDLRYRHEMIDTDQSDARHRHRLRARVALGGKINEHTNVRIQLATGSDDPVSTNQTLTNGFSTKDIRLDLAFFTISCPALPHANLTAGKMKNPFYLPGNSELLWDCDWNPEGGAVDFKHDLGNSFVQIIGSGLYIEERSRDEDSWLGAGQLIFGTSFNGDETELTAGGSYFHYNYTKGVAPFFQSDNPLGNSIDNNGKYLSDFRLIEAFVEVAHSLGEIPLVAMGDFVTNTEADSLDTGWLVGLKLGKTKEPGSWAFRYLYRELEKDAVIGIFSDSDFRGGGTDARGHEIGGEFQVLENMATKATYFTNEIGLQRDEPQDFRRLQLDMQLKFN